MKQPASEYTVTVREHYGEEGGYRDMTFNTIAVSAKQAVNNVAHRIGAHFCFDRPYFDTGISLLHATTVECEGKTTMLF